MRSDHERQVARLYRRRRSLTLGLAVLDRQATRYRATIAECEAELRSIGVEPRLLVTRPALLPIRPKDFRWVVLRHLRASNAPVTSAELTRRIVAEMDMELGAGTMHHTRQRVRTNLDALAGMGLARVVEERAARRGGAVWEAVALSAADG